MDVIQFNIQIIVKLYVNGFMVIKRTPWGVLAYGAHLVLPTSKGRSGVNLNEIDFLLLSLLTH